MFWQKLPFWGWLATLLAAALMVGSLDLGRERAVYELTISPDAGSAGSLSLVFYGDRYDALQRAGDITVPAAGWQLIPGADSVVLAAGANAAPLQIRATEDSVQLGLIRHANAAVAILRNSAGYSEKIDLQAPTESIHTIKIGGSESAVPSVGSKARFSIPVRIGIFAAVFFVLAAIALRLSAIPDREARPPKQQETLWLALPLAISAVVVQLSFYPGNIGYDASLQWVQATMRGDLSEPLGYATTYLMRLFTLFDKSPALLLTLQEIAAALAVALVLRELRFRGVPLWTAAVLVLGLALTPQYPSFMSNLGKDALGTIGILLFTWALLAALRMSSNGRLPAPLLVAMAGSALFAGLMRGNAMPAILLALVGVLGFLHRRRAGRGLILTGAVSLFLAFAIPYGLSALAKAEIREHRSPDDVNAMLERPPNLFANVYIYHLFSAAVASGVPLKAEDTELFYSLAPRAAWADYDCLMTDTTQTSITKNILLSKQAYWQFLWDHQRDLAKTVGRIVWNSPEILWNRQVCITQMLWRTAVGEIPFQTTAVLGYDNPAAPFVESAGQNRSMLPQVTETLQRYKQQTESAGWFWLFWKPALPLLLGIFILGMYVARTRDAGVLLAAVTPLASILLLFVVIPFPAYRYAYPSVLLMLLLCTLAFARPPRHAA